MNYALWIGGISFISTIVVEAKMFPDLEQRCHDFVLTTQRVKIPGFEYAFNPSIVRWQGTLLLSFRVIPDPKHPFISFLGLMWLDDRMQPLGFPYLLDVRDPGNSVPSRAEDARLIEFAGKLYIIYSDNPYPQISKGGFRVYIAEVEYSQGEFVLQNKSCLHTFEGEHPNRREKNWTPFHYNGNLLLSYSIDPHHILLPSWETGACTTIASTSPHLQWQWGTVRGGTPALLIGEEYLAFFHSSISMESIHSFERRARHYFMGAYTFAKSPPFQLTKISPEPIIGKDFYHGTYYRPYWEPIQCIFPGGLLDEEPYLFITYGRQDHEIWIAKLDKERLLQSLIPID